MNSLIRISKIIWIFTFLLICMLTCKKDPVQNVSPAIVTTIPVTIVTYSFATAGGNITDDGGGEITARGVCWATTSAPTIYDNFTTDGTGPGEFTSNLNGLTSNTTYYIRAYATNKTGTAYGNEESFILLMNVPGPVITDTDGNSYNTIKIGTQIWMAENLRTTKYKDGTPIPLVADSADWSAIAFSTQTPQYCWYNNDSASYSAVYGALYNWFVTETDKLCPDGWHLPASSEWLAMIDYLGGPAIAGSAAKESGTEHWNTPNTNATNSSGFTALPGGRRSWDGTFEEMGEYGLWWNTEDLLLDAGYIYMFTSGPEAGLAYWDKWNGLSVRCLKD